MDKEICKSYNNIFIKFNMYTEYNITRGNKILRLRNDYVLVNVYLPPPIRVC